MAQYGKTPNRSEDLARPRERKGNARGTDTTPVRNGVLLPTSSFSPDPDWHPIAMMIWNAAFNSGQSYWYQDSDIAVLYSVCEDISVYKKSTRRNGQILNTIYSQLGSLMLTEGDRRRLKVELINPEDEVDDEVVTNIADYKARLGVG